ncbi:MAG: cadherin domain-containing protein [Opitutales bacterium]
MLRIFIVVCLFCCCNATNFLFGQPTTEASKNEGTTFNIQLPATDISGTKTFDTYTITNVIVNPDTNSPGGSNSPGTFKSDDFNNWNSETGLINYTSTNLDWFGELHVEWRGMGGFDDVNNTVANNGDDGNYIIVPIVSTNDDPTIKSGSIATSLQNTGTTASYSVDEGTRIVAYVEGSDVDGDNLVYNLSGTHAAYFQYDSSSKALEFKSSSGFDYELPVGGSSNSYNVIVEVDDQSGGVIASQTITVIVDNVNEDPIIQQGNDDIVVEISEDELPPDTWINATTTNGYLFTAIDPDAGSTFTWSIFSQAVNGTASIDSQTGYLTYTPDPDMYGTNLNTPAAGVVGNADKFVVRVTDNGIPGDTVNKKTDDITVRVKINPVDDDAPVIDQNSSITINENDATPISLTVTDYDQGFNPLWEKAGGPDESIFNIDPNTGALSMPSGSTYLDFEGGGDNNYSLTVRVTDDTGLTDEIALNIIVQDVNEPPIIDQVSPVNVLMDEDGTPTAWAPPIITAQDPDDNSTNWGTLTWTILSQASHGTATISDSSINPPTILYTPQSEFSGTDSFMVKVNDKTNANSEGYDNNITVNVTITASDDPPEFTTASSFSGSENQAGAFMISATDRDGGSISYSIFSGNDQDFFEINASTGKLEFNSTKLPDFESPGDHDFDNTYEVRVAATDANGSSYQDLVVQIQNSPEKANFTSPSSFVVDENQSSQILTVGSVSIIDPDRNSDDNHTFSFVVQDYSDDLGDFSVDSNSGIISFINSPDFEANASIAGNNTYNFTIRVQDTGGAFNDQNITVQLQDGNDAPSLTPPQTNNQTSIQMEENTTVDSVLYTFEVFDQDPNQIHNFSLSGSDASFFKIVPSTGELVLDKLLDYEALSDENSNNFYDLEITATDNHLNPLSSQPFPFQVQVTDVDEGPFLSGVFSTALSVMEGNASSFVSPNWVAIDPESNSSANIQWYLMDSNNNPVSQIYTSGTNSSVSIAPLSGELTFIPSAYSNKEMNGTDVIKVVFKDNAGNEAFQEIQVSIDAVNDAPIITAPFPFSGTISHAENVQNIIDLNASDEGDKGTNNIHYTEDYLLDWNISGPSVDAFDINNLGVLSFKSIPVYDPVTLSNNRYEIDVSVADEFGGRSDYDLVINVTNAPEKPVLMSTPSTIYISEDEDPISWQDAWTGITVVDPDGGTLTWSISADPNDAPDRGTASVGEFDGNVSYVPNPTRHGSDQFKVIVTDSDNETLEIPIDVYIEPINDPPKITDSDPAGQMGQLFPWLENTPADSIVKSFESNDSKDYSYASDKSGISSTYWNVSGADGVLFEIDQNGSVTFKNSPDYENKDDNNSDYVYEIIITATDDSKIFSEYPLSILLRNVRDVPLFTSLDGVANGSVSISENSTFVYQAKAEDKDVDSDPIVYEIGGGDDQALFSIDSDTGELNFRQSPDFEMPDDNNSDNQYDVVVIANDGTDSNQTITVTVEDVNEAPTFDTNSSSLYHDESDATFSMDVSTRFDDPEKNSSQYIYSLLDPGVGDSQFFTINASTGVVTFNNFIPDYENPQDELGKNLYSFSVKVEDGSVAITKEFTLEIVNKDDLPQIEGTDLTKLTAKENVRFVTSLTALDQDIANSYPDVAFVVNKESLKWVENNETAMNRFLNPNAIGSGQSGASFCVTGDFNRDGALDLILLEKALDTMQIFKNNGRGTFTSSSHALGSGSTPVYAKTADFDEDGFLDLAIVLKGADEVRILKNQATDDITFLPNSDITGVKDATFIDVADVDMDGDQDVMLICLDDLNGNQIIKWYSNDGPLYYENSADLLRFSAGANLEFDIAQINGIQSMNLGDVDQDGDMDLAIASSLDGNFSLFLNDGNGSFASPILLYKQLDGQAHGVQLVDLNQDDKLDVVITTKSPNQLGVILQNFDGGGEFQAPTFFYPSDTFVNDFDLGDIDNDGDLDIVSSSSSDSKIRWFNNDNGKFSQSDEFIVENQEGIVSISVGDISLENVVLEFDIVDEISPAIRDDDSFVFRPQFSGNLYFKNAPDFDQNPEDDDGNYQYDFQVIVQDKFKPESNSTRNVAVSLTNTYEAPVIDYPTAGGAFLLSVKEHTTFVVDVNASNDEELYEETTYSISGGVDQTYFQIDEVTGVLSFIKGPDYETPLDDLSDGNNSYNVVVRATDNGKGDPPYSERVMRITVENDNDAPIINALSAALSNQLFEDSNFSLLLSDLNASDPEGGPLEWSCISDPKEGNYTLGSTSLLYLPDPNFFGTDQITLRVKDDVSLFADVSIEFIVDPLNDAPIISTAASVDHPENEMNVLTFAADDYDGDVLTWSLIGGSDQGRFQLSNNGMLSFSGTAPDFEMPDSEDADREYQIAISVTDGNLTVDQNVTITTTNLLDVDPEVSNLKPVALNTFFVTENNLHVVDLNASDIEGDKLTLLISGGEDGSDFQLSQSGTLQFNNSPDFESPTDADGNNTYLLDVNITDGVNSISRSIAVQVLNATPVLTNSHFLVDEDTPTYLEPEAKNENQSLTLENNLLENPKNGRMDISNGQFLYIPNDDYVGPDSFQLLVIDDQNIRHELNATIDVVDQPDPPIAVDDIFYYSRSMGEDFNITVDDLLLNDSTAPDVGENMMHQDPGVIQNYTQGLLTFDSASQSYTFMPALDFLGPFEFSYSIYDGDDIVSAKVSIIVESAPSLDPWRYLHKFGYFMLMEDSYPWIMHGQMGWVYVSEPDGERTATWMWNEDLGWFWTGNDYFPHFFAEETQMWYNWEGGIYDPNGVAIFDYSQDLYLTIEEFQKKRMQVVLLSFTGNIQGMIEFISQSDYFSIEQKQQIVSEFFTSGQSSTLENLIR